MFDFLSPKENEPKGTTEKKGKSLSDFYTHAEIREKFGVKDSWIYKVVAENNVPKTIIRGKTYFSKRHIDRLFSARKENPEITEWLFMVMIFVGIIAVIGIAGGFIYYMIPEGWNIHKGLKNLKKKEPISMPEARTAVESEKLNHDEEIRRQAAELKRQREELFSLLFSYAEATFRKILSPSQIDVLISNAYLRMAEKLTAPFLARTRHISSRKVTSRCQCSLFSMPQCARIQLA